MELKLERRYKGDTYTIGRLYVNGERFCDTLEDVERDLTSPQNKVYGKTAIPKGTYDVVINYSPKFKRKLPRLLNVPHFAGILIHRGNTAEHTHGCILVGRNTIKGRLTDSSITEEKLMQVLATSKEKITINIV